MLLLEESDLRRRDPAVLPRAYKLGEILTILTCKNIVINLVNQLPTRIYCMLYDRLLYKKKKQQIKAIGTL